MYRDLKIGFIGGGNMAKAIAMGLISKGFISSANVIVSSPTDNNFSSWNDLSVRTTHSNAEVIWGWDSDIIFLAFKPHQLDIALKNALVEKEKFYKTPKKSSKLFISILAGVPSVILKNKLWEYLQEPVQIIRVMPNTPALIGEGCFAISDDGSARPEDVEIVKELLSKLGICEIIPEYLMPAVTGVSGSGPAYIYMVIEALADGGVKQGLPRKLANTFAAKTVLGAAKMVLESNKHTSQLKDEVSSPGGTTIHAIHALEKGGIRSTIINAVEAASKRAEEISKKF